MGRNEVFTSEQLEKIVLYTLRARYRMEQVYTWVDRVLVSVNPVVALPIYTPDHMQAYNKSSDRSTFFEKSSQNERPPHVFGIAQNAIRNMQDAAEDQAVILLGSMGSGKSEAAKLIVQYLCEIGENSARTETIESEHGLLHPIGQQILHAFTILESFGNAATLQNRNSSRFAKMISVEFSKHGYVIGGGFTTHYFEKSRVIHSTRHERNFHVFYQVLAGVQHDPSLRDALDLNRSVSDFDLLKGADPEMTDASLDARDYRDLMSSFSALRIRKNQRLEIVRVIAALLHLGNVDFVAEGDKANGNSGESSSCVLKDPAQIVLAAKLLEVEPVVLDNYFRTRQFFSKDGNKTVSSLKVVTVAQARKARDTFIRSLYEALFNFLVETLNGILGGIFDRYEKSNIVINSQGVHVLDIVGFENLDSSQNGFDQLCFNYWSEKVQSFFVHNTLAINFSDLDDEPQHIENRLTAHSNMDLVNVQEECLSLFESIPFGIFALLNEHSKMRSPNDEDLVTKILAGNEGLNSVARPNVATTSEYLAPSKEMRLLFVVQHFGEKVTYSGKGLAAKNTLSISATCSAIMQSSKNAVLRAVGAAQVAASSNVKAARHAAKDASDSSIFRSSLSNAKEMRHTAANETAATDVLNQADALLHALNHTGKNFLVCVKPNENLEEGTFDSDFVLKQVRQNHLVDLIKASRSIFTVHLTYNHFFRRYKSICGHRGTLESLLRSLSAIGVLDEEKYVVGKLKVYLTSHQWKQLEKARYLYLNACATMIQRNMLRGVFRKKSSRLLYVMRGLRQAVYNQDTNDIIQHLADCTRILGKHGTEGIRVMNYANQLISRLDEEAYVISIISDATKIGHPLLMEHAIQVVEKYCPSVKVDHLKAKAKQRRSRTFSQRLSGDSYSLANQKLRESIIKNDTESLMGALATMDEPSTESLERKLATMMIIRALEEKRAVENLTQAVDQSKGMDRADMDRILKDPMVKAMELGIDTKFPDLCAPLAIQPFDDVPDIPEVEEELPAPEMPNIDTTALITALQKAMDESNIFAVEKILNRLTALGVSSNETMAEAKKKVSAELNSMSTHSERKQMIKFLGIAKIAQDVELLTCAIDAAVSAGVAKWDFNLKNAEKEREKLAAVSNDAPPPAAVTTPAPVVVKPVVRKIASVDFLWKIWEASSSSALLSLRSETPSELQEVLESKLVRHKQLEEAEERIRTMISSTDAKRIEEVFEQAVSIGLRSTYFAELFEHYSKILADSIATSMEENDGLRAAIKFLSIRMDDNAEIRKDDLVLLSTQIDEFTKTHDTEQKSNEEVLINAGTLRRKIEACLTATARLEAALVGSFDMMAINALELSLEQAKLAGVTERILVQAEKKLLAAKSRISSNSDASRAQSPGARASIARKFSNTSQTYDTPDMERMRSDTTGWGGYDESTDLHDKKVRAVREKDALAFNQFENLRGYNAQSERTMAKKLSWDGRALSQSLSVLDDPHANQLALSINRCILGYMRDRIVLYREMLAQYILQVGLAQSSLVDEIYVQLMKQLTKNPKRDSSIRGWSLFAMCAESFPPSAALEDYVLMFLKAQVAESNSFWRLVRNFSAYSLRKLENLLTNGTTGFIPSMEEIQGYEARPPFLATIELLDGTPLTSAFPVTPEMTVEQLIEICAHFLGLEDHVTNFLGLCSIAEKIPGNSRSNSVVNAPPATSFVPANALVENNGNATPEELIPITEPSPVKETASTPAPSFFHRFLSAPTFLDGSVYLGDIFEKELIRGRDVRFVLKIRLSPTYMLQYNDEVYDRLMYIQVLEEIVKGNLPLLEEDSLLRLTALAVAVDCGDDPPLAVEELLEMNILDYIPVEWHAAHEEHEWAALVLNTLHSYLQLENGEYYSVSELQRIYIEEVTRHRLYGAMFFPCKLLHNRSPTTPKREAAGLASNCLGVDLPSYFVVAVNGYGLHFLSRDGLIIASCEYSDVVYCGGSYHQYKFCLKKASDPTASTEDIVVTTKYSDELSSLVSDYKEITHMLNDA